MLDYFFRNIHQKTMLPAVSVLPYDGKGSSFFNYDQQGNFWRQITNLETVERPSALTLQMDAVAR